MKLLSNLILSLSIFLGIITTSDLSLIVGAEDYDQVEFLEIGLNDAITQSKNTEKPLYISLYATWCTPCKVMKINTFTNNDLAESLNNDFIAVRLDGEQGDGKLLMKQMNINAFPTQLIFSSEGQLVWSKSGYLGAKELIKVTQSIK